MADSALNAFNETASTRDTSNPARLLSRGFALIKEQRFQEAIQAFESVLGKDPRNIDALNSLGFICYQHRNLERALAYFRAAASADPRHTTAATNLVNAIAGYAGTLSAKGRLDDAGSVLVEALDHVGVVPNTKSALAMSFFSLSQQFYLAGCNDRAVHAARIAAFLSPETPGILNHLHHALRRAESPSKLSDYSSELTQEQLGKHIFIACFPKSGSTFLSTVLQTLTGFPNIPMTYAYMQNEQELYLPYLLSAATQNKVTQQHCRATMANLHLMQGFGIRPIILVRNIFDTLVSWKEFVTSGAYRNTFYPDIPDLDATTQMDLIIADRAIWYLSFFAGWKRATDAGRVDALWLSYEEMIADKPAVLRRIAAFYDLDVDDAAIMRSIETADVSGKIRFNKGISGRGQSALTDQQKETVANTVRFHPGIDFSMIGL